MFAFFHQIFRPITDSNSDVSVSAQLLNQANVCHDAHMASELRVAAVAALGVIR